MVESGEKWNKVVGKWMKPERTGRITDFTGRISEDITGKRRILC